MFFLLKSIYTVKIYAYIFYDVVTLNLSNRPQNQSNKQIYNHEKSEVSLFDERGIYSNLYNDILRGRGVQGVGIQENTVF